MGLFSRKFDSMQTEEQWYFAARNGGGNGATHTSGGPEDARRGEGWTRAHHARSEARYRSLRGRVESVGEIHRNRRGDWVLSGWKFNDPEMPAGEVRLPRRVDRGLGSFTAADLVEIYERETGRKVRDDS